MKSYYVDEGGNLFKWEEGYLVSIASVNMHRVVRGKFIHIDIDMDDLALLLGVARENVLDVCEVDVEEEVYSYP